MSAQAQTKRRVRRSLGLDKFFLVLAVIYLLVPLATTLVFGLSSAKGVFYTFQQVFSDPSFSQTFTLSLRLALGATVLAIVLVTPTAYWVQLRVPKARPLMEFLTLMPLAVPAIVMALGLYEVYAAPTTVVNVLSLGLVPLLSDPNYGLNIVDTQPLLICAYVILSLPFVYRPIDNSLRAINTAVLTEAAYSLGSGWWRTFLQVILPNIWPGVISAALLTFSTAMGEFTLAALFGIFTFPIYLDETGQGDARKAALLVVLSFVLTLLCVLAIIYSVRRTSSRTGQEGEIEIAAAK